MHGTYHETSYCFQSFGSKIRHTTLELARPITLTFLLYVCSCCMQKSCIFKMMKTTLPALQNNIALSTRFLFI